MKISSKASDEAMEKLIKLTNENKKMTKENKIIIKEFGKDFDSEGGALTLNPSEVTDGNEEEGTHTKVHDDGWTITGKTHKDYYVWVNDFEAIHSIFGKVWGNFEDKVYADSEEGFQDFYAKHTPSEWDYEDI